MSKDRIDFLKQILLPIGFLPLAMPLAIIFAGPDLAINMLSSNAQLHQIYYQYTATITPFLFIAAIYGFRSLQTYLWGEQPWVLMSIFTVISILGIYLYSPLPGMRWANTDMFYKPLPYRSEIEAYLRTIPLEYTVAASNTIGSHLSHREHITVIPRGVDEADYVVFLFNDPWASPTRSWQMAKSNELRLGTTHIKVFEKGSAVVFRKRNIAY